jgi:Holliday junction resolvasome RuvABC endonuclease subunit
MGVAVITDGRYVKSWYVEFAQTENIYLLTHNTVIDALRIWESSCEPTAEDFIAFENIPMRFGWSRILIEVVGGIKTILAQRNLPFMEISPTTIKKCLTGSGKSPKGYDNKKQLIINAVNEKFGLAITEDNEADAIGIAWTAWLIEKG